MTITTEPTAHDCQWYDLDAIASPAQRQEIREATERAREVLSAIRTDAPRWVELVRIVDASASLAVAEVAVDDEYLRGQIADGLGVFFASLTGTGELHAVLSEIVEALDGV